MGLVAAIPAVVIYNAFARSISGYKALLLDASAELLRLVSRDIDRATIPNSLRKAAE
jgi:biopolymer transport protein ExbB